MHLAKQHSIIGVYINNIISQYATLGTTKFWGFEKFTKSPRLEKFVKTRKICTKFKDTRDKIMKSNNIIINKQTIQNCLFSKSTWNTNVDFSCRNIEINFWVDNFKGSTTTINFNSIDSDLDGDIGQK